MPLPKQIRKQLRISCPACNQRLSVAAELMGQMIDCETCEARFHINEEVVARSKKIYPGERTSDTLNRFKRVPVIATTAQGMREISYDEDIYAENLSFNLRRILTAILGSGLMAGIALLLLFSGGENNALSEMSFENKMTIGGFASIVGTVLLVYANPKARAKVVIFGMFAAAGLLSIPFFINSPAVTSTNPSNTPDYVDPTNSLLFSEIEEDPLTELKNRFLTNPLENEQKRLEVLGGDTKAYGIYLTNLIQSNLNTVRNYLISNTKAGSSSHAYPRENGDYLIVLTDVSMDITEVTKIADSLGSTKEVHSDIGVIVVSINNKQFEDSSAEKLND
jgi:transcription elongation factor Elf1